MPCPNTPSATLRDFGSVVRSFRCPSYRRRPAGAFDFLPCSGGILPALLHLRSHLPFAVVPLASGRRICCCLEWHRHSCLPAGRQACAHLLRRNSSDLGFHPNSHPMNARRQACLPQAG